MMHSMALSQQPDELPHSELFPPLQKPLKGLFHMAASSLSRTDLEHDTMACEELIAYDHEEKLWACAISSDGRIAASVSKNNSARVFHVHASDAEQEIELGTMHNDVVYDVSIGGGAIATSGRDGVVYVHELSNPTYPILTKGVDDGRAWARAVHLSRDGKTLVSCIRRKVFVTDVATGNDLHTLATEHFVFRLAVNIDQTIIFMLQKNSTEGKENFIQGWDTVRGLVFKHPLLDVEEGEYYPGISTDATGDMLAIADSESLRIWHVSENEVVTLPGYTPPRKHCDCAITPDGSRVVAVMGDAGFGVWCCTRQVRIYSTSSLPVNACAISDDGGTVVIGCEHLYVRVWSLGLASELVGLKVTYLTTLARERFRNALQDDQDSMSIGEAIIQLNGFLKNVAKLKGVSGNKLVRVFEAVADEYAETVGEEVFVRMFRNIYEEQETAPLLKNHVAKFRDRAKPSNTLPLVIAARMIRNLRKEVRESRNDHESDFKIDNVREQLRGFASSESNRNDDKNIKIDEKSFIAALKKLVYEI